MFTRLVNMFFGFLFLLLLPVACLADTVGFLVPSSGLGDQSFNDMTYSGLIQARKIHKFKLIKDQAAEFNEGSRRAALTRLLEQKPNTIIVNGFEFEQLIREYATKYPDTLFIIHDFKIEGIENVASTVFNQYQGSCLAGALAGWITKTDSIGFIGGMDIPVINEFLNGFNYGVEYANPRATVTKLFLSDISGTNSGFDVPQLGFSEAEKMYSRGADIIFGVAGLSGNGIIRAAQKQKKFAIGVDADQDHMAKGLILTSVMKRLDTATLDLLDRLYKGEKVSGAYYYGLKENGVSLTPMSYTRNIITAEILAKLEQLKRKLIQDEEAKGSP